MHTSFQNFSFQSNKNKHQPRCLVHVYSVPYILRRNGPAFSSSNYSIQLIYAEPEGLGNSKAIEVDISRFAFGRLDNSRYDRQICLAKNAEDDPPVIFGWENVVRFVEAMCTARAQDVRPRAPFNIPARLAVANFKTAVVNYARKQGAATPVRTAFLVFTLHLNRKLCSVCSLRDLNHDHWFHQIFALGPRNIAPIAVICAPRPKQMP